MHVFPGDEHFIALEYALGLASMFGCVSVLDVGAGTGRALRFLTQRRPEFLVAAGVEPSAELRAQAVNAGFDVYAGAGEALPFADGEFDMVIATGVMHHVPRPAELVAEMCRVTRTLIVLSDSNRFGQGPRRGRAAKVLLHKSGLWPALERVRTRGKGYMESDGDGIFYSYSIFDSQAQLDAWADRTFVIPTQPTMRTFFGGMTSSTHGMLVAIREPTGQGWAGVDEPHKT